MGRFALLYNCAVEILMLFTNTLKNALSVCLKGNLRKVNMKGLFCCYNHRKHTQYKGYIFHVIVPYVKLCNE